MAEKLITIKSTSHPAEAYIYKAKLEYEGIPCFIADENVVSMNWFFSWAVGGVKLKVKESDVGKALEILSSQIHNEAESEHRISWLRFILVILLALLILLKIISVYPH